MDILKILILPIHEHGTCFYLFVSSSVSFINILSFSVYKSFTSWLNLFLSIYSFRCSFKWHGFLNFSSDSLLLVYRNKHIYLFYTYIYIQILYPETSLNSFLSSNSYLVESSEFSIYIISCRLQIENSSVIWIPFLFLAQLLWLGVPMLC